MTTEACRMRIAECGLRMADLRKPLNRFPLRNPHSAIEVAFLAVALLLFSAGALRAQETPTPEERSAAAASTPQTAGSITGRVSAEDGSPLADAAVYLYRPYARVPGPPRTATTDGEGVFRASNLEPGLYLVNAQVPGFVTAPDTVSESGEAKYYRPGDTVNLTLIKGGVITGTVRDATGDAVVAAAVRAVRVRDATGRPTRIDGSTMLRLTDDRGIYRLYGLLPGTYLVAVGGSQGFFMGFNAYDGDAPTYYPSSTRDTATEVTIRPGEEVTGIDIRYRGERGHLVSGTVSSQVDSGPRFSISITLRQASTGGHEAVTFLPGIAGTKPSFLFVGLPDGEYELMAQQVGGSEVAASVPRRVTVKGADVTGIVLELGPLGSIAGRVNLDAPPKERCEEEGRAATLLEAIVNARRAEKLRPEESTRLPFMSSGGSGLTEQGEFTVRNLSAGGYRLTMRLPDEAWYVRSILQPNSGPPTLPLKNTAVKSALPTSPVITLNTGGRVSGVTINVAQDAAALRGRIALATEEAEKPALPSNLKVYLVPQERERAEDLLRYGEKTAASDGSFSFTNLAPGRYLLLARPVIQDEGVERDTRPLAWDTASRAKLLREAEAANNVIELKPCQRLTDYALRFAPPAPRVVK